MRNDKGQFIKGSEPIRGFKKAHKINVGRKHSQEWNEKISKSNKGRISPMKGRKMSDEAKQKISRALKGKPIKKIRGKNHYNWKGGKSELQKIIRHSVEYRNWRERVFRRDNYTCQKCGIKSGMGKRLDLNADHYPVQFAELLDIYKIRTIEDAIKCKELWKIENGRTLCIKCHQKTYTFRGNQYVKA